MSLRWHFPINDGGDIEGINDPLREYFEGDHETHIAREIIQNSLDAGDPSKNPNEPVSVSFQLLDLSTDDIPGWNNFETVIKKASEFARSTNQERADEYYDKALEIIKQNKIKVLKISDYNTVGLNGEDDDTDNHWARLTSMIGASSHKGDGGGSFGIGKGAAFAASKISTVFYVTRNKKGQLVFTGKTRLSTFFDDSDHTTRRGTGQLGIKKEIGVSSVRDEKLIPKHFHRSEQGTDIYILGYDALAEHWEDPLIVSTINNFWASIHRNKLIVEIKEVNNKLLARIDNASLLTLIDKYEQTLKNVLPYYKALTEGEEISKSIPGLGKIYLYIKKEKGLPRKIIFMRAPLMKIEIKRFPQLHEQYAGVLICDSRIGNAILRKLEPPAHDKWDPALGDDQAKKSYRLLQTFIKNTLKAMNVATGKELEDIPDAGKYLPEEADMGNVNQGPAEHGDATGESRQKESPIEIGKSNSRQQIKPEKIQNRPITITPSSGGAQKKKRGTKRIRSNKRGGAAGDEEGGLLRIDTDKIEFRSFLAPDSYYRIILTPRRDAKGAIKVVAVGEESDFPITITSAIDDSTNTKLEHKGSFIKNLRLKYNKPFIIRLKFSTNNRYALGIESYES